MDLSIIIPMYNTEEFISRCIHSVQSQSLDNYEIIVVNDGSTDAGPILVEKFCKETSNIKMISQENQGIGGARNTGLREAKGQYILFLDADDKLIGQNLNTVINLASTHKLDILTFNHISGKTEIEILKKSTRNQDTKLKTIQDGVSYIACHNYSNHCWNYLIKRSYLEETGIRFIPGRYLEDVIFTMELFLQARRMSHVDLDVYGYILREESTMTGKRPEHLIKMIADYYFCVEKLNDIIHHYKERMSEACLERCCSRMNILIYFTLVRMLKSPLKMHEIKQILNEFTDKQLYPYQSIATDEYGGRCLMSLMLVLFKRKLLYLFACKIQRIIRI